MPDAYDTLAGLPTGKVIADPDMLANPDLSVLRLARRDPPPFPLDVLGDGWRRWCIATAEAAACPVDNVVAPLLASASALIGHARWAQATPGWAEPPHLWCGVVGDSGTGKSPGADALLRDVLPEIESRMLGDYPERLAQWRAEAEAHAAQVEIWKADVRTAQKQTDHHRCRRLMAGRPSRKRRACGRTIRQLRKSQIC